MYRKQAQSVRMSGRRDSTCQKHELPKSLQGAEDAEFVWSMITDRFPNAAPLLCEMEAVIDRAEDLLQQLRTPCREIETSTSFCTQDSEESAQMISAKGSLTTDNENTEDSGTLIKSTAEIQVSVSSIDDELEVNDHKEFHKDQCSGSPSSDWSMANRSSFPKGCDIKTVSYHAETNTEKTTKEARSLEEWGKVVENAMRTCMGGEQTVEHGNGEKSKMESVSVNENKESCIVLHRQEKSNDIGNSMMEIVPDEAAMRCKMIDSKDDTANVSFKDSGDESLLKMNSQRTPLNILEEFAKRCGFSVEYEYSTDPPHRYKSNVYVIRGYFVGYTATCRGFSEHTTKNDLATKILQMVANHQMTDEKMELLQDLTRDEMMEIINFGEDGLRETAQKKLYQLCLERGTPVPKYCVAKMKTCQGFVYVATCTALGYTCEGRGVRECGAKKAAAESLYQEYCQMIREGQK